MFCSLLFLSHIFVFDTGIMISKKKKKKEGFELMTSLEARSSDQSSSKLRLASDHTVQLSTFFSLFHHTGEKKKIICPDINKKQLIKA